MTTKKRLCNIKGLSEAKVDKIKVTAVDMSSAYTSSVSNMG